MDLPPLRLVTGCHAATMTAGTCPYGAIHDAALLIEGDQIAWIGPRAEIPVPLLRNVGETYHLDGRWMTPGLIDPHTHLIFGGSRVEEFEGRNSGLTYATVSASGGGILATVRATRAESETELAQSGAKRLRALAADGVCLVEIKSGYGLDLDNEMKVLRAARKAGSLAGVGVTTTFLGLHALPPEWRQDRAGYVAYVRDSVLPDIRASRAADAVDAFCEAIAFSAEEVGCFFDRARELNLRVKLHADQLSDCGGAELAARYGALSADHLEYASETGIAALAQSGTVAVLLPGAYFNLRETKPPPVDALRASGVPIALGTDLNPGTSPVISLRAAMNMAVILFALSPEEALAGVTREAARALGLARETGTLTAGKRADLAVWDISHPAELSYWMGGQFCHGTFVKGQPSRSLLL